MRALAGLSQRTRRIFVVKASLAHTSPKINVSTLSSHGRLDVVARATIAALSTRRGSRDDTLFYAVLEGLPNPPVTIELKGWELPKALVSEAEVGTIIRDLLRGTGVEGAAAYGLGFRELVSAICTELGRDSVFYMHERGVDVGSARVEERAAFILGDHLGVDAESERWLEEQGIAWLSLGPTPYFTEHCITFIHSLLDGWARPCLRQSR